MEVIWIKSFFIYTNSFLFEKYLRFQILNIRSNYSWGVFRRNNISIKLLKDEQLKTYVAEKTIKL